MDEEAVKKSIVFTIKIKVTKDMKEGNNQENVQEDTIDPDERDLEQIYRDKYLTILPIILKIQMNTSTWNKLPKILVLVKSRYN